MAALLFGLLFSVFFVTHACMIPLNPLAGWPSELINAVLCSSEFNSRETCLYSQDR